MDYGGLTLRNIIIGIDGFGFDTMLKKWILDLTQLKLAHKERFPKTITHSPQSIWDPTVSKHYDNSFSKTICFLFLFPFEVPSKEVVDLD